jgi:hypothetical protein
MNIRNYAESISYLENGVVRINCRHDKVIYCKGSLWSNDLVLLNEAMGRDIDLRQGLSSINHNAPKALDELLMEPRLKNRFNRVIAGSSLDVNVFLFLHYNKGASSPIVRKKCPVLGWRKELVGRTIEISTMVRYVEKDKEIFALHLHFDLPTVYVFRGWVGTTPEAAYDLWFNNQTLGPRDTSGWKNGWYPGKWADQYFLRERPFTEYDHVMRGRIDHCLATMFSNELDSFRYIESLNLYNPGRGEEING